MKRTFKDSPIVGIDERIRASVYRGCPSSKSLSRTKPR